MAQDIIIRTLCDVCLAEDDRHHDGKPYTLGDGPALFDIDLCVEHAAALADLMRHARARKGRRKPAAPVPASPKAGVAGAYVCDEPECGRAFPSAQGLSMHRFRAHGRRSETPAAEAARLRKGSA
jgi:hypothetical protein